VRPLTADAASGPPQSAWLYHASGVPLVQLAATASSWRNQRVTYNAGRRPVAVYAANGRPLARYAYGSLGERMAKTAYGSDGVARTSYSLYREQRLAAETDAEGRITAHYIYLYGKPVAKVDIVPDNSTTARLWRKLGVSAQPGTVARLSAIHTDHLGVPPHDVNWDVNELRTLNMEQATFNKLLEYGDPAKAGNWTVIRQFMMEFNALPENESNAENFPLKLAKLAALLRALNIEGIDLSGADRYKATDAKNNRDTNTRGLNPADYPGTILR